VRVTLLNYKEFVVGDWVVIDYPSLPWFHGGEAEVVEVFGGGAAGLGWHPDGGMVMLAISCTPGYTTTLWPVDRLTEVDDYNEAVKVFGEDYFA